MSLLRSLNSFLNDGTIDMWRLTEPNLNSTICPTDWLWTFLRAGL